MPSLLLTRFGFYQKAYTFVFVTKGKDCHQHHLLLCMLLRLRREKIRNLLTKKMRKNKFQKVNSLRTFLGNWIFHAKLYYTMPKMSKNGKIKTWLQFCHSWLWTKSWSMIFKVPFYLFDQSGHKTIHDFCYYTTVLVSTKSLRKWSTYPT